MAAGVILSGNGKLLNRNSIMSGEYIIVAVMSVIVLVNLWSLFLANYLCDYSLWGVRVNTATTAAAPTTTVIINIHLMKSIEEESLLIGP